MKLFGISEFAARLPNAICGIFTLNILYYYGKKLFNETMAWWWVLLYLGSITPHFYFKSGIIDPWFNLFIFLGIVQLYLGANKSEARTKNYILCGLFLGLAAARLSGPYLAGTTLVMALAIPSIAVRFESFFSGDVGLSVDYGTPPTWLSNLLGEISIEQWSLYVVLPFTAIALFAVLNLSNTRAGRTWRAVRDNEVSAALAGINIGRTKVVVFVCASALAGLSGALYGFRGLVAPSVYPTDLSLTLLTAAVIGGLRSVGGAIFGTFAIVFLPDLIEKITKNFNVPETIGNYLPSLTIGILLLLTVILNPRGAAGALEHIRHRRKH